MEYQLEKPSHFDSIPREVFAVILSFVSFSGSDWLNTKLVNKYWKIIADKVFDPSTCDALYRMLRRGTNEEVLMTLILDPRIDPSLYDNEATVVACRKGMINLLNQLLLDRRVDPTTAFSDACSHGQVQIVRRLLQDDRIDFTRDTILYSACKGGHSQTVRLLLKDNRIKVKNAIGIASRCGHLETVNVLLEDPRVDPSVHDNYAIQWASIHGHIDVIERLLEDPRVDITQGAVNALDLAHRHERYDVIALFENHLEKKLLHKKE
eukprot:TRINITY_DN4493_c0_g1_i1.p1 TRINITY_DN4493_c0_g1~~TRINITY_DN4493_c0_g1_i1.p1  ORF type:complete len:265 (+),score=40.08 TRINITY_DN4493_c0_g1_i1:74-868(+)